MAAYAVKARWLVDEASTGTAPTTLADDTGSANTLAIDYGSGGADADWTSIAAGNGLDFFETSITTGSAVAELVDLSVNGTLGADLKNQTQVSIRLVMDLTGNNNSAPRILALGTSSGDADLAITAGQGGASNLNVRWDREAGGTSSDVTFTFGLSEGVVVLDVVIDTTQATGNDRIKVYNDNVQLTRTGGTNPALNDVLSNTDSSNRIFSLGNRPDQARNPEVVIYYCEIGTGVLSASQLSDYTALLTDNDADWQASGLTISPNIVTSEEAVYQPSVSIGQVIEPNLVSSEEVVYQPEIKVGQVIEPNIVSSEEAVYQPEVKIGKIIEPNIVASEEVVYQPTITLGSIPIFVNIVPSEEQVYNPAVLVGVGVIFPNFVQSEEFVYSPSITGGAEIVSTKIRKLTSSALTFVKLKARKLKGN